MTSLATHCLFRDFPANNVDRAKHFYHALLGWKIEPTKTAMDPAKVATMQYHDVITGEPQEGTLRMGGLDKRQMTENITNHVMVEDIDKVLERVGKVAGRYRRAEDGYTQCRPECDHPGYRRKHHRDPEAVKKQCGYRRKIFFTHFLRSRLPPFPGFLSEKSLFIVLFPSSGLVESHAIQKNRRSARLGP